MKKIIIFGAVLILFSTCKKSNNSNLKLASLNVVNAGVELGAIKVNYVGQKLNASSYTDSLISGIAKQYTISSSNKDLAILRGRDNSIITRKTLEFENGNIFTVYLSGKYPNIDTLVRKDFLKPSFKDSLVNIRFVNLCSNSSPINIILKNGTEYEVNNLGYREVSAFKGYLAKSKNLSYIFEARKSVDNSLLLSYTFSITALKRFKNISIIMKGLSGTTAGTNAFGFFEANYY